MLLSVRKMVLVVLMALALLLGMLGWSIHVTAAPQMHHPLSHSVGQTVAWYCPAPPFNC